MSANTHEPMRENDPRELSIEDIGPLTKLRLVVPPGKITVLNGPNGSGKTQALEAVGAAQSGTARLTNRDGTTRGRASCGGVTIKVGRGGTNRRSGDLEVESLEDRLSIATLVDPGMKNANAADSARIKSLVLIAGGNADIEKFHGLTGGDVDLFRDVVTPDTHKAGDLVAMAAKVKRDFEAAARKVEADLEHVTRERDAKREAASGVDTDGPHDAAELERERDEFRDQWVTIVEQRKTGLVTQDRANAARELLSFRVEKYDGPTASQAEAEMMTAQQEWESQLAEEATAQAQLDAASLETHRLAKIFENHAVYRLPAATDHEAAIAGWQEFIDAAVPDIPTEDDIDAARELLVKSSDRLVKGVVIREAITWDAEAKTLSESAAQLERNAESLRDAGRGAEDVLSRAVADLGVPLKVDEEFRLLADHPVRGWCYFAELSMGEKWRIGLDIAIGRADGPSLLAIPQEAFESLDRINRHAIAERIAGTDIAILTAEAQQWTECLTCGELSAMDAAVCDHCDTDLPPADLTVSTYE